MINSKDLIQWQPVSGDFWKPTNIDKTRNTGIEVSATGKMNIGEHKFQLKFQYDYVSATDKVSNKQLIYVPQHKAMGGLSYRWHRWSCNYYVNYVGEVYITTSNTQALDDYLLSDVDISRTLFNEQLVIGLKINNLFDTSYQSVAYRPMPTRNYFIHINFKI